MSNTDFPMPKTVEMPRTNATTPPPSDYAPKRGLEAVADAIERPPARAYTIPTSPPSDYKAPKAADKIRESLKELRHREMREMCIEIFKAANGDTITKADLPDVLDKFAYGD